ncbi:MAG: zf-HC2 domain-containing protein [Terracidiphilus sp.]
MASIADMKTTGQHEFHPDTELLNAFAEHAAGERERRQVLAHLAVCGRCRKVLALSQQAVDGYEVEFEAAAVPAVAAAAPTLTRHRSSWWRNWRLAWMPVAALSVGIALAVYVHMARVERNAETARNTAPELSQNETAANSAPLQQAQPATPPASAPSENVPKGLIAGSAGQGAAPRSVATSPAAQAPPSAETQTVTVSQAQPAIETESAQAAPAEPQVVAGSPAVYKVAPPAAQRQQAPAELAKKSEDRSRQVVDGVAGGQLSAVSVAPMPGPQNSNRAATPESSPESETQSKELPQRAGAVAGLGALSKAHASFGLAGTPLRLPSGLAVASVASANHRILAIDSAGSLFVSKDSGIAWQPVTAQWTGRAILVLTRTIPPSSAVATPTAEAPPNSAIATPGAPPGPFFEIVNDKNAVWQSTDGMIWIAK